MGRKCLVAGGRVSIAFSKLRVQQSLHFTGFPERGLFQGPGRSGRPVTDDLKMCEQRDAVFLGHWVPVRGPRFHFPWKEDNEPKEQRPETCTAQMQPAGAGSGSRRASGWRPSPQDAQEPTCGSCCWKSPTRSGAGRTGSSVTDQANRFWRLGLKAALSPRGVRGVREEDCARRVRDGSLGGLRQGGCHPSHPKCGPGHSRVLASPRGFTLFCIPVGTRVCVCVCFLLSF